MLVAIDHGNYSIKTPHFSFVSGLTEHTVRPPMADEVLEYDGKYWALTGQRLPYMRDKTRDERYFVLSLFAIAKELSAAGANTRLSRLTLPLACPRSTMACCVSGSHSISGATGRSTLSIIISP